MKSEKLDPILNKIGAIASIISLVICFIEAILQSKPFYLLVLICTLFAAALISMWFAFRANSLFKKYLELKNAYVFSHRIAHYLRNAFFKSHLIEKEISQKIQAAATIESRQMIELSFDDESEKIFSSFAGKLTTKIKKEIELYANLQGISEKFRLTIKIINPIGDIPKWELYTVFRDSESFADYDEVEKRHIVGDNTAFEEVIKDNKVCFVSNNLRLLYEEGHYKNSNMNWQKRYNATLVALIRYYKKDTDVPPVYYGVIAVDCMNEGNVKIFDSNEKSPIFNIMGCSADILAVWFSELECIKQRLNGIVIRSGNELDRVRA